MSRFEEFLELQTRVKELQQMVKDQSEKIEQLDKENRDLKDQLLEKENKLLRMESEARRHASVLAYMEEEKKNGERVQQRLEKENSALSKRIEDFTVQLGKFATMIEETNAKLERYYQERDALQQEKFELNKKLNAEILDLTNKLNDSNRKLDELNTKFQNMKDKYQKAKDSVMGISSELDKMKQDKALLEQKLTSMEKELEATKASLASASSSPSQAATPVESAPKIDESAVIKENEMLKVKLAELNAQLSAEKDRAEAIKGEFNQKLAELNEKLCQTEEQAKKQVKIEDEAINQKTNAVISSLSQFLMLLKLSIPETKRNLRILVPKFSDLQKHEVIDVLRGISSSSIIKNIGCTFNLPEDQPLVNELTQLGWKLTKLNECNFYSFIIDDNEAALSILESDNSLSGFFTKHPILVPILSQSVISLMIRGDKI